MAVTPDQQQSPVASNTDRADKYENPLRKFRTYSYHFILAALDSTDIISFGQPGTPTAGLSSIGVNSGSFYERPPGPNPRAVKQIPPPPDTPIGNYSIVIDTRYDTDFFIQDVEWGTSFIGNAGDPTSATGLNTYINDGTMTIIEPRGVKFLNVLAGLASNKSLGLDPSVMPFLLKVIFIGYNDDGSVDTIVDIPPYGILIVDIDGNIDAQGSTYKLKFCGCDNGAGWLQTYLSMPDGIGFTFGGRNPSAYGQPYTLSDHLTEFQSMLNDAYKSRRNVILGDIAKNPALVPLSKSLSETATIEWQIKLEPGSKVLQTLDDFGKLIPDGCSGGNGTVNYVGKKQGGVVELINNLLASSPKWAQAQVQFNPTVQQLPANGTERYAFKVTTEFQRSSPATNNKIIIIYYVSEYIYQAVDLTPTEEGNKQSQTLDLSNSTVYTFDYIFTGQNIDIIHLDMNLSMGLALWQNLITSRSIANQHDDVTGAIVTPDIVPVLSAIGALNPNNEIRKGTPIFPPAKGVVADLLKEHLNQATSQTADDIWRQFAGYQSVNTKMTIHGNPLFLQKFTNPSKDGPDYVKINIKVPTVSDDIWEYEDSANPTPGGYYETFWYDGYFNIITAQNKFLGGQFTQELNLWQVPGVTSVQQQTNDIDQTTPSQSSIDALFGQQQQSTVPSLASQLPSLSTNTNPITPGRHLGTNQNNTAPASNTAFVAKYWNAALTASQTIAATRGSPPIDPNYILAAAAVESTHPGGAWGSSGLTTGYNNFFGFKAFPNAPNSAYWDGQVAVLPTKEVQNGMTITVQGTFKGYTDAANSFEDYANLISNPRLYGTADASTSIADYAFAVQNGPAGHQYSTNPNYQALLISAYNQILAIEATLGIMPNTPFTGTDFSSSIAPATSPFLPQSTSPYDTLPPATPSSYSATDRTVQAAAGTQKTLVIPFASVAASL